MASDNMASDNMASGNRASGNDAPAVTFDKVSVGNELPTLVLPVTRTLIVSGALASRDYQDVHHDAELARQRGSKDIFMNILTTNGLVGRYVTDWTGPSGRIDDVSIRLGAPNYPDDVMTLTGSVTAKSEPEAGATTGSVVVSLRGKNSLGDHVTGTVTVSLPIADGLQPADVSPPTTGN